MPDLNASYFCFVEYIHGFECGSTCFDKIVSEDITNIC